MASRASSERFPMRKQTNKLKNEKDEDAPTNINYTCHICSIDVPAAFSEEHNASKKHRAHARIVAAASERMRALLTARPAPRARAAGKYCGACNSVVENDHEKTNKHKQAVRDDQLLCVFASMYCGEDNQNDTDESEDEDSGHVSDAKVEVNDQEGVNVEEKIKDYQENGNQKDYSNGRAVDNAAVDQTESANHEEKIEKEKKNKDDGHIVNSEIVTELDKGYKNSSGASSILWQQGEVNRDRGEIRYEQNAIADNSERRFESDGDEKVDKVSKEDEKAKNNTVNVNSMKDSNSNNAGKTNKIGSFYTAQPNSIALKTENIQTSRAEDTVDKQPNKGLHNPVGNSELDQLVEVINPKNNANNINNIGKPDKVETSKADLRTKSDENQKQASVDGNVPDPYDPQHDFFWSLVKRYKIEHSWSIDYINIHPAGNKIQIIVNNEKLNVPYDHFHSFREDVKRRRCMVCMVYFDKGNEDDHTASKQHMDRIMLAVNDSHCYREITHWRHCILCNEVLMGHFEEKHKMLLKHFESKLEATVRPEINQRQHLPIKDIDPFNHMGPYDPSKHATRNVQNPREENVELLKRLDFFWALEKRYKLTHVWSKRYINIQRAGNKIQIIVDNEKLNVLYDNFHSFHHRKGDIVSCFICMVFVHKIKEDEHTLSQTHMDNIMRAVDGSHCYRKMGMHSVFQMEWGHCILCNENLNIKTLDQHKTSQTHINAKFEATVPQETKQSNYLPTVNIDPFNHMGPYDPSKHETRNVQNTKEDREKSKPGSREQKGSDSTPKVNLDQSARTGSHYPGASASQNIQEPKEKEKSEQKSRGSTPKVNLDQSSRVGSHSHNPGQSTRRNIQKPKEKEIENHIVEFLQGITKIINADTDHQKPHQRKKITLQRQETRPKVSVEEKENGRPKPRGHICVFKTGSRPEGSFCISCGTARNNYPSP